MAEKVNAIPNRLRLTLAGSAGRKKMMLKFNANIAVTMLNCLKAGLVLLLSIKADSIMIIRSKTVVFPR